MNMIKMSSSLPETANRMTTTPSHCGANNELRENVTLDNKTKMNAPKESEALLLKANSDQESSMG